ncbi:MAG TPA: ATP-binding protein [Anaerolineae bacterium]
MFEANHPEIKLDSLPRYDAFMAADLWRYALDSLEAAVCVVNRDLRVVIANHAWDTLMRCLGRLDLLAVRLTGESLLEVLQNEDRDRWVGVCQRLFDLEEASYWAEFAWSSDMGQFWLRLAARALFADNGEVVGISMLLTDITQERQATEAALKRRVELRGLFEVAQSAGMVNETAELYRRVTGHLAYLFGARICAIATLDESSPRVVVREPAHGVKESAITGLVLPLAFSFETDDVGPNRTLLFTSDDHSPHSDEIRTLIQRWQVRNLLIAPLRNQGRLLGYLLLADTRDAYSDESGYLLTAFAGMIAAAIDANTLVLQLQEHARELSAALAEIQELGRIKDQMIQNVSHELRLPLMVIQGYADLLKMGAFGPLGPEPQQAVDVIGDKVMLLAKRVSDIVTLRGLQRTDLHLEPIVLAGLVREVIERARPRATANNVALIEEIASDATPLIADRQRIQQVIGELVDNAIKFSPNGGEVRVAVREGGEVVYLKVSDQGIGIPAAERSRIWDRFFQLDGSTKRRFGGTGVGLAVVKQIVDAHGGQVWAESREGGGSDFYVALRRSP